MTAAEIAPSDYGAIAKRPQRLPLGGTSGVCRNIQ